MNPVARASAAIASHQWCLFDEADHRGRDGCSAVERIRSKSANRANARHLACGRPQSAHKLLAGRCDPVCRAMSNAPGVPGGGFIYFSLSLDVGLQQFDIVDSECRK